MTKSLTELRAEFKNLFGYEPPKAWNKATLETKIAGFKDFQVQGDAFKKALSKH